MESKLNPVIQSINVSIRLLDIKCLSFSLTEYAKKNTNSISFENYEFQFRLEGSVNQEEKTFLIILSANLFEKAENIKYELAELKSLVKILIVNFDEVIMKADKYINVPEPVMQTCVGIAVSGIRGMYSIKLEDTLYSNAVVPLIDPKLFTQNLAIQVA